MIDVSDKPTTLREASAVACIRVHPDTIGLIKEGKLPKGDPLAVAKVAAVQAVKRTSDIIPYCHPMSVTYVGVDFDVSDEGIFAEVSVKAICSTGVEMEAMTGAAAAVLTLYDMLKGVDRTMEITQVRLMEKLGGKTQYPRSFQRPVKAAVVVVSDSVAGGDRVDRSGVAIKSFLEDRGASVEDLKVVPDDEGNIREAVMELAGRGFDLVVTTGGTGIGPRDVTPEALGRIVDREISGFGEAIRNYGQARHPYACLSRALAGTIGTTVILALPGSTRGVMEGLTAVFSALDHALEMVRGGGH